MVATVQDPGMPGLMDTMNARKTGQKSAVEETQDRFLRLLVTQMKNQDPLNPLDNAQVTSQFAQLSTVSGIEKLNDTLASLMSHYQVSQSLQAASLIGHGVLVPGSRIALPPSGNALFGVELAGPADKVEVVIRDAEGRQVRTLAVDGSNPGSQALVWDGKADDGSALPEGGYTFTVSATRHGEWVATTALQFGLVDTVTTGSGGTGVKLNITGIGAADFSAVRQIL